MIPDLVRAAQKTGLRLTIPAAGKLIVEGPQRLEPLALLLLEHKEEVLAALGEPVGKPHYAPVVADALCCTRAFDSWRPDWLVTICRDDSHHHPPGEKHVTFNAAEVALILADTGASDVFMLDTDERSKLFDLKAKFGGVFQEDTIFTLRCDA